MEIAYTVGVTKCYDEYVQQPFPKKAIGGSVWRTQTEVARYLLDNSLTEYSIYPVELPNGWEADTQPDPSSPGYFLLKVAAPLMPRDVSPSSEKP